MTGVDRLHAFAAMMPDGARYELLRIAKDIERETLPRPLFEDGEPVQFGDCMSVEGCKETVQGFKFYRSGPVFVSIVGRDHEKWVRIEEGERVKRPDVDTWERIAADVDSGNGYAGMDTAEVAADVLRRCKKLAGVE